MPEHKRNELRQMIVDELECGLIDAFLAEIVADSLLNSTTLSITKKEA